MSQCGVIDGLAFARAGTTLAGALDLADLPRLLELGCRQAWIRFAIRGDAARRGKPALHVEATGEVDLTCQRCLELVTVPIAVRTELELAASQAEIDLTDDDVDRVLADPSMAVSELVEDEVILALPMVPTHAQCPVRADDSGGERSSPFAALAALKTDRTKR
ncbi:MAG: DUF177 domain-containing protein [Myxococcales bacterium]|nr:MAG: DUF177 domain-containing protein [Myxococcales bacterium]